MSAKSWLHKQLWQRLPYHARRAALAQVMGLMGPRLSRGARPGRPLTVAGAFQTASGLGESARLCRDSLRASGETVTSLDLTAALMQRPDFAPTSRLDMPDSGADDSGTKASSQSGGTLIVHVNAPQMPLALWHLGRAAVRNRWIVGYWAWELPTVPPDWAAGIRCVHEIWVPSQFTADAVRPLAQGRPVRIVPHPVAYAKTRATRHPPPVPSARRPFTVLTMLNVASSFERKNPGAAVAAFRAAFGEDPAARLLLKVSGLDTLPPARHWLEAAIGKARNITLIDAVLQSDGLAELYAEADVVLSLHRSEGFGLVLAEAMCAGLPTIATDWSGSVDFVDVDTGLPIPCRYIPATDPQQTYHYPGMQWADPDLPAAVAALQRLRADPALCARLGAAGQARAHKLWSRQAYAATVRTALNL